MKRTSAVAAAPRSLSVQPPAQPAAATRCSSHSSPRLLPPLDEASGTARTPRPSRQAQLAPQTARCSNPSWRPRPPPHPLAAARTASRRIATGSWNHAASSSGRYLCRRTAAGMRVGYGASLSHDLAMSPCPQCRAAVQLPSELEQRQQLLLLLVSAAVADGHCWLPSPAQTPEAVTQEGPRTESAGKWASADQPQPSLWASLHRAVKPRKLHTSA
mmetsp:Transcript_72422/g.130338  ORF Transcript_72422/g.130338 Transcript_72422/m.130338 type:complete len:216 (+) Transcript_72422:668-1315(+)